MPDGEYRSIFLRDEALAQPALAYSPPIAVILCGLDANEIDLNQRRVSVSARFLRFLIGEIARSLPFDAEYYRATYPDVEAARLAGDVATLHEHFVRQGYFERRRPHDLPFDPAYYVNDYDDLAHAFAAENAATLHRHFTAHGWQEGRAGVAWQRREADRWIAEARAAADNAGEDAVVQP